MSAFPSAPLAHVFLCLYDTAVVFLEACQALIKYGLHVSERWRAAQAERVRRAAGLADRCVGTAVPHVHDTRGCKQLLTV